MSASAVSKEVHAIACLADREWAVANAIKALKQLPLMRDAFHSSEEQLRLHLLDQIVASLATLGLASFCPLCGVDLVKHSRVDCAAAVARAIQIAERRSEKGEQRDEV